VPPKSEPSLIWSVEWCDAVMTSFPSVTAWSSIGFTTPVMSAWWMTPSEPPVSAAVSRMTKRRGVPGTSKL
jgi:hypothetical protein